MTAARARAEDRSLGATRRSLARQYLDRFPAEATERLERGSVSNIAAFVNDETAGRAGEVMRRLTPETAALVLAELAPDSAQHLLAVLSPNRAATLLARLEWDHAERLLATLPEALSGELRSLMSYPPGTAGSLMDPRAVTFRPDALVRDAVRKLQTLRRRRVQDVFLVDADGRLVGSAALQDIVLADPNERLDALVRSPVPVSVQATAPRDAVLEELERHRAGSLPVVDFDGHLLGVLRQSELITTAQQTSTEDLLKMVGAGKDERALSPARFAVRKRLPWLQINLLTAFLAASVVAIFEGTIARFTALAVLLPVVAGQSGNTGAQALAVTMRGLALREIRTRQWFRVTIKELLAGAMNGVAVALTTAIAVYVWSRSLGLAFVIAISMVLSMTMAGVAGAIIPMILTSLRQDPAQSSSIILTTVTDVVGFLSFLGIATLLANWI